MPRMKPKTESMTLRPSDEYGCVPAGRWQAAELRETIEHAVACGTRVVVDFTAVEAMSPSFADELFAKLDPELVESGSVQFEHLPEDHEPLTRFVAAGRRAPLPS